VHTLQLAFLVALRSTRSAHTSPSLHHDSRWEEAVKWFMFRPWSRFFFRVNCPGWRVSSDRTFSPPRCCCAQHGSRSLPRECENSSPTKSWQRSATGSASLTMRQSPKTLLLKRLLVDQSAWGIWPKPCCTQGQADAQCDRRFPFRQSNISIRSSFTRTQSFSWTTTP
jgi:hypothetical protein